MKVAELFDTIKMENEAAERIVELIKQKCVKPGSMKTSTMTTSASTPSSLTEEIQAATESMDTNSNVEP